MSSFEYLSPADSLFNLLCPICHAPFTEPWMSATCEHVYCRGCIEEHLKGSSTCPCDRSVLEVGKGGAAPAPRLVKLLCDELVVQCSRCQSWTGQRADWARHSRDDCGKVHESCPHECGQTGFTDQGAAKKHQKDECRLRMVECEMCKLAVRHETLESHVNKCPASSIDCPHCQLPDLTRFSLSSHLANECPEATVSCPHSRFGCSWCGKQRVLIDEHLSIDCPYEPLKVLLHSNEQQLCDLRQENLILRRDGSSLQDRCEILSQRVDQLDSQMGHTSATDITHRIMPSSTVLDSLTLLSSHFQDVSISTERATRASEQSVQELRAEISTFQIGMHDLRGEMMALQQAQYYESASRFWARSQIGVDSVTSTEGKTGSPSASSLFAQQAQYGMHCGHGYPFPPFSTGTGHPMYAPTPPLLQPVRRFYGWPYPQLCVGGSMSPDGGPNLGTGGTKL
ncbi:MAG: hypothetical protein CYPHOPRED_002942 [Cyphobasidiales sp. Tagirdzhanova-0007]|nr:MAG: hypothetical protein CYPHOPRED_002942 [Cyphobasidiales sp. Tagirdzhanova-0007]